MRVESGVLQMWIQCPQVLSRCTLCLSALHDALDYAAHSRTTFQVANICFCRANHQRLCARLSDLHFANCPNLDGIAQGCASAVALPCSGFRRSHQGFLDGSCHHFLLSRTIWSRQRRTATILPARSGAKNGHALLRRESSPFHHEAADTFAAQVAISGGVESEASPLWAGHVGLRTSNERARRQAQVGTHGNEKIQRIKLTIADHKSGTVRGCQRGRTRCIADKVRPFQVEDEAESIGNDCKDRSSAGRCDFLLTRHPIQLVVAHTESSMRRFAIALLLGQSNHRHALGTTFQDQSLHRIHAVCLIVGDLKVPVVKKLSPLAK
mmetsp:Transcript_16392/g.38969  ORF Transcript_16392/g.38969 Transcript_16392/m.38969 type:complete len:324 (+) Transcript_16392:758-1729(+)